MLIIMMVQKKGNYYAKINTNNFRDKSLRKLRDMGTSSLNQALPWSSPGDMRCVQVQLH